MRRIGARRGRDDVAPHTGPVIDRHDQTVPPLARFASGVIRRGFKSDPHPPVVKERIR